MTTSYYTINRAQTCIEEAISDVESLDDSKEKAQVTLKLQEAQMWLNKLFDLWLEAHPEEK